MIRHLSWIVFAGGVLSFALRVSPAEPASEIFSDTIPNAKQPQLAEAARMAQAAKKSGTEKAVVVAGQDNNGNLVISGVHQNGKNN